MNIGRMFSARQAKLREKESSSETWMNDQMRLYIRREEYRGKCLVKLFDLLDNLSIVIFGCIVTTCVAGIAMWENSPKALDLYAFFILFIPTYFTAACCLKKWVLDAAMICDTRSRILADRLALLEEYQAALKGLSPARRKQALICGGSIDG
jgi:hypothetical protein